MYICTYIKKNILLDWRNTRDVPFSCETRLETRLKNSSARRDETFIYLVGIPILDCQQTFKAHFCL